MHYSIINAIYTFVYMYIILLNREESFFDLQLNVKGNKSRKLLIIKLLII